MIQTILFITFDGDEKYEITNQTVRKLWEFQALFNVTTEDGLFILIETQNEDVAFRTFTYHLFDTKGSIDIRGVHTVIRTTCMGTNLGEMIHISTSSPGFTRLGEILRRDPRTIARILKEVEKSYVKYNVDRGEKSLFTDHKDNIWLHYGVGLLLATLGCQNH